MTRQTVRKQGWVFPLFSPDSDDRLSLNFHRFVILYISCDTWSVGLGPYCLPKVSNGFNTSYSSAYKDVTAPWTHPKVDESYLLHELLILTRDRLNRSISWNRLMDTFGIVKSRQPISRNAIGLILSGIRQVTRPNLRWVQCVLTSVYTELNLSKVLT